mmetsp:Transcript_18592/g.25778  ORF Transcript_18592/g.25778 Transcript_18592/m.25778 type:complete len:204 (+) Transcript_18592:163-774(+)
MFIVGIDKSFPCLCGLAFLDFFAYNVFHVVEVPEQEQESDHVKQQHLGHEHRVRGELPAVSSLEQIHEELEHLHLSQVPSPPEVLGSGGSGQRGGQEVVAVHAHMHPGVQSRGEVCVSSGCMVSDHPPDERDGAMVIHVKHRHLLDVSLEEHDERVHELIHLGNVEDPDHFCHLGLLGVVGVSPECVLVQIGFIQNLQAHVQA